LIRMPSWMPMSSAFFEAMRYLGIPPNLPEGDKAGTDLKEGLRQGCADGEIRTRGRPWGGLLQDIEPAAWRGMCACWIPGALMPMTPRSEPGLLSAVLGPNVTIGMLTADEAKFVSAPEFRPVELHRGDLLGWLSAAEEEPKGPTGLAWAVASLLDREAGKSVGSARDTSQSSSNLALPSKMPTASKGEIEQAVDDLYRNSLGAPPNQVEAETNVRSTLSKRGKSCPRELVRTILQQAKFADQRRSAGKQQKD
jgi:hypothetical protein